MKSGSRYQPLRPMLVVATNRLAPPSGRFARATDSPPLEGRTMRRIILVIPFLVCPLLGCDKIAALNKAILAADFPGVCELIAEGADLNARNSDGETGITIGGQRDAG